MTIEKYKFTLTHQMIDNQNGKSVGKLEPDYVTEFYVLPNTFDVPKEEIYKRLLYNMEKELMRGTEDGIN